MGAAGVDARKTVALEARILRAFSAKARRDGPGSVVMADLARDLGISTKTLYRVFPSKAQLVHRLMEAWARRLSGDLASDADGASVGGGTTPYVDQLLQISEAWQQHRRRFSQAFWEEIERDFPDSYSLWVAARVEFRQRILDRLGPIMRPGVEPELAMELFDATLVRAMDQELQRRLGVDGRTAVRQAAVVWASGALSEPLRTRERSSRARARRAVT